MSFVVLKKVSGFGLWLGVSDTQGGFRIPFLIFANFDSGKTLDQDCARGLGSVGE